MTNKQKAGLFIIAVFSLFTIIAPMLVNGSPFAFHNEVYLPPSAEHWLGTNSLGQDTFVQLAHGAKNTLIIGVSAAFLSTILSAGLGLMAGYSKKLDTPINSIANILLILPSLLLILIVASFTGGSMAQLILVIGLLTWAPYMRVIRAEVFSLKEREFVKAAKMFGASPFYLLKNHVFPHIRALLKTKFILSFRSAMLTEAGLSFLGIGDPNTITLGKMMHLAFGQNQVFATDAWQWLLLPPVLLLITVTVAAALVGEEHTADSDNRQRTKTISTDEILLEDVPEPMDGLSCRNVKVEIGESEIIADISFKIEKGEIVGLVGESGSGKTTLARAIYGLLPEGSISGSIQWKGTHVYQNIPSFRKAVYWSEMSIIPQDPRSSLNPLLTIKEQFMEVMPSHKETVNKREVIARALGEVNLPSNVMNQYPHELSGGMLSRVMIALALLHSPDLIIADESTSALDPILKKEIIYLLQEKIREKELSLLFITHDRDVAYSISDRVIVMNRGAITKVDKLISEKELINFA